MKLPQDGTVDLRDNAISNIQGLDRIPGLRRLFLSRNVLSRANEYTCFKHLEALELSDNRLSGLEIGSLTALKYLKLAGTALTSPMHIPFSSLNLGMENSKHKQAAEDQSMSQPMQSAHESIFQL